MRALTRLYWGCVWLIAFGLALAPAAWADTVHTNPGLALQSKQVWVLVIGSLVPLFTYVLNHVGPWVTEPMKAAVLVVVAAIAGGLYTAIATSSFGFNSSTLEMVLTAVIAALGAHHWLWKPSGVAAKLGGGTNAPKQPAPMPVAPAPPTA